MRMKGIMLYRKNRHDIMKKRFLVNRVVSMHGFRNSLDKRKGRGSVCEKNGLDNSGSTSADIYDVCL